MDDRLRVESLSFSVPGRDILCDATLSVSKGEKVGIIGPNGSGKTTLLKHIYRALPVKDKTIFLTDVPIEEYGFKETAKLFTVMKQENTSEFDYKVIDMVLLGRAPYHSYFDSFTAKDKEKAMEALRYVGMEDACDKSFATLSGGEKQRVLIARSITQETELFIMDEPTNHLDVHFQWSIMELITGMDKTVLGVFHELNLASRFCDRLYVLDRGKIVGSGTPEEVITEDLMRDVFRVRTKINVMEGKPYITYMGAYGK